MESQHEGLLLRAEKDVLRFFLEYQSSVLVTPHPHPPLLPADFQQQESNPGHAVFYTDHTVAVKLPSTKPPSLTPFLEVSRLLQIVCLGETQSTSNCAVTLSADWSYLGSVINKGFAERCYLCVIDNQTQLLGGGGVH